MTADEERRKLRNNNLLGRVMRGEDTALYTHQDTWWPPRPMIEKSKRALQLLFGKKPDLKIVEDDNGEETSS